MTTKQAEPARPSVEAILTDIHNTLTEGMDQMVATLARIEGLCSYRSNKDGTKTDWEGLARHLGVSDEHLAQFTVTGESKPPKETVFLPVTQEDGTKKLVEQAPVPEEKKPVEPKKAAKAKKDEKPKITVEALRAKISEFAEAFSMNEALAVNEQFGGARKISGIPEVAYEKVFMEMDRRLQEKAAGASSDANEGEDNTFTATVTKEDIQKVGGAFVKQYGDPAFRELLAKFVAKGKEAKISQVDPSKYSALYEALANA